MKKLLSLTLTLFIFFTPNAVLSSMTLDSISYSDNHLAQGLNEYQKGNYTNAVDLWYECTRAKPGVNMEDMKNRGVCANNIGHMVFEGLGYQQDYRLAIEWLEQAKDWGYQNDDGKRMIKEAKARLEDARDKSVPNLRPMFERLGYGGKTMGLAIQAYNNGQYKTAFLNFKKCADKSKDDYYVHCPIYLGMLHYTGIGTEQDTSLAIFHLQKGLNARPYDNEIVDFGKNTLKSARKKLGEEKKLEKTIKSIESNKRKLEDQLATIKNPIIDSYRGKANTLFTDIKNNPMEDIILLQKFDNKLVAISNGINNKIKAEQEKIAAQKKAEQEKIAAKELLKKIALIPPKSDLEIAQNFIKDLEKFVEKNPNEFDIMDIAMFKINTKPLSEGVINDEQMGYLDSFRDIVNTSSTFKKFQKTQQDKRIQISLDYVDLLFSELNETLNSIKGGNARDTGNREDGVGFKETGINISNISSISASLRDEKIKSSELIIKNPQNISQLENLKKELTLLLGSLKAEERRNIAINEAEKKIKVDINRALERIDKDINKQKTYLSENLSSITPELMTLIVANVNKLEKIKKQLFSSDKEKLDKFKNINIETSTFLFDNNVLTSSELALKEEENRKKKVKDSKKKEEAQKIANAKKSKPYNQEQFIKIINKAKIKFNTAETDAVKGKVLYDRTQEICGLITSVSIKDWKGKVSKVETNQDGWGVLEIELDTDLKLSTRDDVFGDYGSNTLINPGSNLFKSYMYFKEGDTITFSGSFFKEGREKGTCLNIMTTRLKTRVLKPTYEFKFTQVEKLN